MVTRNKTVFGLLVVAIICGVIAVSGATQAQPAAIIHAATCSSRACNALIWGQPATDAAGNPLPAGACTMSSNSRDLCIQDPVLTCNTSGSQQLGCNGTYQIVGVPGYFGCWQAINKCP